MTEYFTMEAYRQAADVIQQRCGLRPTVGMILGSGLNALAESIEGATVIPFGEVPYFPAAHVQGHVGRLVLGTLEGRAVIVMQGRGHFYEGNSMAQVGLPVRVMRLPGEVMILRDHINLLGMAGHNPLFGPNLEEFGPRFPSMNDAYAPRLRAVAHEVALRAGIPHHQGVYICLAGPAFETPADVRFLRLIGADAVGMSTVPEVITARHCGMEVMGLSGISNRLVGEEGNPAPNHEEVLEAGRILVPRLETIIRGVLNSPALGSL